MFKRVCIKLINIYQKSFSPDHGILKAKYPYGFCRFYPSCSEYAKQTISKHGVVKGGFLGLVRVLKCNPWSTPALDNIKE